MIKMNNLSINQGQSSDTKQTLFLYLFIHPVQHAYSKDYPKRDSSIFGVRFFDYGFFPVAIGWLQIIRFINISHSQYANLASRDSSFDITALRVKPMTSWDCELSFGTSPGDGCNVFLCVKEIYQFNFFYILFI